MGIAKKKAPAAGTRGALTKKDPSLQSIDFRSSTKHQHQVMLEAMRRRPQTTTSFRDLGIFQCSARIFGLRAKGYVIETTRVTLVDHAGVTHPRAALYSLVSEPGGVRQVLGQRDEPRGGTRLRALPMGGRRPG